MFGSVAHNSQKEIINIISALACQEQSSQILYINFINTPIGEMFALTDANQLHMLEFCDVENLEKRLKFINKIPHIKLLAEQNIIFNQVKAQLDAYFLGQSAIFSVLCALNGSDFSRQTWQTLQKIPVATTLSYRQQAEKMGFLNACRAVARANSQNKIAIIIPCHRVIGSDGRLTGYTGGLARKKWLLDHENAFFSATSAKVSWVLKQLSPPKCEAELG